MPKLIIYKNLSEQAELHTIKQIQFEVKMENKTINFEFQFYPNDEKLGAESKQLVTMSNGMRFHFETDIPQPIREKFKDINTYEYNPTLGQVNVSQSRVDDEKTQDLTVSWLENFDSTVVFSDDQLITTFKNNLLQPDMLWSAQLVYRLLTRALSNLGKASTVAEYCFHLLLEQIAANGKVINQNDSILQNCKQLYEFLVKQHINAVTMGRLYFSHSKNVLSLELSCPPSFADALKILQSESKAEKPESLTCLQAEAARFLRTTAGSKTPPPIESNQKNQSNQPLNRKSAPVLPPPVLPPQSNGPSIGRHRQSGSNE